MKKVYEKPMVLIEDFSVTERFASVTYACGTKANLLDNIPCDILNEGMNNNWDRGRTYIDKLGCKSFPENDESCYHSAVLTS